MTVRININGREIECLENKTILDVALENGIEIPHLCYDKRMEPYGGCGLCVVEVEGSRKLLRACATNVKDAMVIKTHTKRTIETRKTALKLLASDHRGDCRPPCVLNCPAHTDVQGYVGLIANGEYTEAVKLIKENLPLPASIGRVCPHPCEDACRRSLVEEPVSIAALKSFVADMDLKDGGYIPEVKECSGKSIAVIGAGPAGLSAAFFLAKEGHSVTIYEAMDKPGGMLRYGIPEYRLPKAVLDKEIELIKKMGVNIVLNTKLGEDISLNKLKKENDAVFLSIGAWKSSGLRCEGEDTEGVLGGIDLLIEAAGNKNVNIGKSVVVVGGGNTAMDVARTSVRLGAGDVKVLYRRTEKEMPAEEIEIKEAKEEGVEFNFLVSPIKVTKENGKLHVRCQKMELGEMDASGRRRPVPIEGEEEVYVCDSVVAAIGQRVDIGDIKGVSTDRKGIIEIKEGTFETNLEGVFAGGDAATGPKIAIEAIAQGKNAAEVMNSYLKGNLTPHFEPKVITQKDLTEEDFSDREKESRVKIKTLDADFRKTNFTPVNIDMTEEEAKKEASRCLECGCKDYFECKLIKYINEYEIDPENIKGEKHNRNEGDFHPFIERNPDKCVLCGLCIRACDEVMDITALGLIDRGFEAIAAPEFGLPLKNTDCISCGECTDVCPTGACMERAQIEKEVPVKLDKIDSVCSYCGAGCALSYEVKGNKVFRARPDKEKDSKVLCAKGRFGIGHIQDKDRLTKAMIRKDNKLEEVKLDKALFDMVKKLQRVNASYGKGSIAVLASPKMTNEEMFVLKKISEKIDTKYVGSMTMGGDGLKGIFGLNASTNSFEEIHSSDVILSVGEVYENHTAFSIMLKDVSKKAKLVSITKEGTKLDAWADESLSITSLEEIKGLIKALIDNGYVNEEVIKETVVGYDEFKLSLEDAKITDRLEAIAKIYGEAKKPTIVIDECSTEDLVIKALGMLAAITENVGKAHRGVIILRDRVNTQGMIDMGLSMSGDEIFNLIEEDKVKALVVLGEDISIDERYEKALEKLDYLAGFDLFMTNTLKKADLAIPLVSLAESTGRVTRSDRKVQKVNMAVKPLTGHTNFDILTYIADTLGIKFNGLEDIQQRISIEVEGYMGVNEMDKEMYWPNGKHTLYLDAFKTTDNKAILSELKKGKAFKEKKVYDSVEKSFVKFAKENGLKIC